MENLSVISAEETADFFGSTPPPAADPIPEPEPPKIIEAPKVVAPPATVKDKTEDLTKNMSPAMKEISNEMIATALAAEKSEQSIRNALVVGNFSAAVDHCLDAGLMAEALLFAQCGDPQLWNKTQEIFFNKYSKRYPFVSILQSVIKNSLMDMVLRSDLTKWKETLAVLSTYGKSEEFPALCEALAARLESELFDKKSATLCYMCAANIARVVSFWVEELKAVNIAAGTIDRIALQQFVEKVVIFTQINPSEVLSPECIAFFSEYSGLLASQGRLDVASRYLKGDNLNEQILRDRLYNAGTKLAGSKPPVFPFNKVNVGISQPSGAVGGGQHAQNKMPTAAIARSVQPAFTNQAQAPVINQPIQQQQQQQQQQSSFASPQSAQQQAGGALPPGWMQLIDQASGRPYFVNQATGQSQWEAPQNFPAMQPQALPQTSNQSIQQMPVSSHPMSGYPQQTQPGAQMQMPQSNMAMQQQQQQQQYTQQQPQQFQQPVPQPISMPNQQFQQPQSSVGQVSGMPFHPQQTTPINTGVAPVVANPSVVTAPTAAAAAPAVVASAPKPAVLGSEPEAVATLAMLVSTLLG
jgi:protein transport protein SEC31